MAREAMLKLFETYLLSKPPAVWKELFREAAKMAFNVKYMFREEVMLARARFNDVAPASGGERQMMNVLIEGAFGEYGEGLVDQETLAASNFLTEPQVGCRLTRCSWFEGMLDTLVVRAHSNGLYNSNVSSKPL